MSEQVTNYKCPACMGPLQYSAGLGKMKCDFCDSVYEVSEIESMYAEKGNTSRLQKNLEKEEMKTYSCPSCGAELICDETAAASSCPYCGNTMVIQEQVSGILKPDFVIPFKLDKKAAMQKLKEHYKGRPFLPSSFTKENHMEELRGVYVPFWMFDGKAEGEAQYEATDSRIYRKGDYEVTETEHYEVYRAGRMEFEKVPVDASSKMPDDYMDSIEPYDYQELKPFSNAYLSGFLADKYDVSAEECAERADKRCMETLEKALYDSVVGYQTCTTLHKNIVVHRGKVHYALLPVWMLSTKWNGKTFLFAMNGQTGKMVGNLPVSWKKFWLTFTAITVPLTILLTLFLR